MKHLVPLCTLLFLSFSLLAQYEKVYQIPLPEKFDGLSQEVTIKSSPNPNLPAFVEGQTDLLIWKHSTTITATADMKVVEAGAYLLNYGTWKLRVAFKPKEIKEKFRCSSLQLKAGESITFPDNDRYGSFTETGWNFWYVIAENADGKKIFGYEILETTGKMSDGTQVLPLLTSKSQLNWTGKAGDSDYSLSGTLRASSGKLQIQEGQLRGGALEVNMESLQHENNSVAKHLKDDDFFAVKSHPKASFTIQSVEALEAGKYRITGEMTMKGITQTESFEVQLTEGEKQYQLNGTLILDRTKYDVLYGSTKAPGSGYSIADEFSLEVVLVFRKDYPGSKSWNSVEKR